MGKERNGEIAACPECSNPLISTFAFAGAEWFCWECRWRGGVFYEKTINRTPELEKKLRGDKKKFDEVRHDLWLGGERVRGCEKCESGNERHLHHLTDEEKARCKKARETIGIKT